MIHRKPFGSTPGRRALDGLDREMQDHIERETEDNVARGMTPEEARRRARLAFGNVALAREDARRVWVPAWLDGARQDLRYALRTLWRSRTFALAAVTTLALAIGANTTMFSVLDAVLFRPLPYRAPEQLAMLFTEDPTQNLREGRSTLWEVEEWRNQSQSFADIATFDSVATILTGPDGAEQIPSASISPNLLPLLGVQAVLGRSFATADAGDQQGLVLISHRFWQSRFGGARDAVGAALVLDGRSARIIGVLPAGFQVAALDVDVWQPHTGSEDAEASPRAGAGGSWFVIGRLRPDVTFEQAQAEMSAIARRLNDPLPAAVRNRGISVVPLSRYLVGPQSRLALWMLGGAVFCVFLIAAANVTSLSLARVTSRGRELAVRAALGASAGRLVRQLLTESVLLGAVSGALGTLLALAGVRFVRAFGPGSLARLDEIGLDFRVLGWALGISVLAGILVGLAPAIATVRRDLRPSGEESGRTVSGGAATRRVRRALVVAEFALAIVLLVGAGLLLRSWWHVNNVDPGFAPERILVVEVSAPTAFSIPAQRTDFYQRVLEQMQTVPGVEQAGIIGDLFIGNPRERILTLERDEGTVSERLRFTTDEVSAGFFKALGTPLLRGRFFSTEDGPEAPRAAIINDAMARRSWPGQDPVGRRFRSGPRDADGAWYTVVGVVGDMRRQGLERAALPQIFVSLSQNPSPRNVDYFIRTSSADPLAMAGSLRAAVRRVETNAPVYGIAPLERQLGNYLTQRRFQTSLLAGFSLVALLMAAVGIYGLIQYSVATRTQEIGLRMAIGAQSGDIFRMMIGEGLTLSLTGVALGLVGAWWLGRAGSSLLFGVTSGDPWTFATVSLLLTAVACAACYLPARRAMAVDPIVALRVM